MKKLMILNAFVALTMFGAMPAMACEGEAGKACACKHGKGEACEGKDKKGCKCKECAAHKGKGESCDHHSDHAKTENAPAKKAE